MPENVTVAKRFDAHGYVRRLCGSRTMASPTIERDQRFSALMRAAQTGDARAYSDLLKEITPRLRSAVRQQRPFLQPQDVEDLVQDVLLSLHAVRATYDSRRPFMPWLMAIARNRLADGARRYARRAAHETDVEASSVTFPDQEANKESAEHHDPEALKRAIEGLPPGQRQALNGPFQRFWIVMF